MDEEDVAALHVLLNVLKETQAAIGGKITIGNVAFTTPNEDEYIIEADGKAGFYVRQG